MVTYWYSVVTKIEMQRGIHISTVCEDNDK